MNNIIKIIIDYGPLGIAIAAFSEAIFMPLPMEVISLPIYLVNSSRAIIYSLTLIFFSALGSLAGYFIGRHLGKPLLVRLVSAENITKIKKCMTKIPL